ncbi:site-specific integrase [Neptunomonas japonica]|uniref:site-specific integrase n=1 Tax=Neptunomonas japonica TaxID=417574 RepID=UPI000423B66D|nr:site-specific integrase [Neptunomonas japonica]
MSNELAEELIEVEALHNDSRQDYLQPVSPESERYMSSRHEYRIEIKDYSGSWLKEIQWPDDNGRVTRVKTTPFFTGDEELDRITSAMLFHMLQHYMPSSVNYYGEGIELITSRVIQGESIVDAFQAAILDIRKDSDLTAIKTLSKWLIAYEHEEYPYDFHAEVIKLSRGGTQNAYSTLFTLDAEMGPFVREEMLIIQEAVNNPYIHLEDRVILALSIVFGMRPIQISLMKQSDFVGSDKVGIAYLNVPRVKQRQKLRRMQFTKRILSDELAGMIRRLIEVHGEVYGELDLKDPPLIMRRTKLFYSQLHPYMLRHENSFYSENADEAGVHTNHTVQPYQDLYDDSEKTDEGHHLSSNGIYYRLNCIANFIPRSPRTCMRFHLNPYRFRYTLGTNAVSEGKTEAEVADLLDHSNTGSVKHYFRYTQEMFEILNDATNKRVEQRHFVAAWTREGDQTGNIYGEEIIELKYFTVIGKCHKGSLCMLEPAVACYQCDRFCPNKDTKAHKNALENLLEKTDKLERTSTGPAVHQLDEAVAGCKAAIAFSEGEAVMFIENGETSTATPIIGSQHE